MCIGIIKFCSNNETFYRRRKERMVDIIISNNRPVADSSHHRRGRRKGSGTSWSWETVDVTGGKKEGTNTMEAAEA